MEPLFPELPEELAAATDEELESLEAAHVEAVQKVRDKDVEFLGDRDATTILAELKAGVEALKEIRAVITARAEAEENFDTDVETLASEVMASTEEEDEDDGAEDDEATSDTTAAEGTEALTVEKAEADDDDGAAPAEPEVEVEEPETAEVVASRAVRRRTTSRHQPITVRERDAAGARLTSTLEYGNVRGGQVLDRENLVAVMDDAIVRTEGMTTRSVLAQARASYPANEWLNRDASHSHEVISRIKEQIDARTMDEVVASGGRCVPFTPRYDLPFIATDVTPVWDSLPTTGADRGGITFPTPLGISDAADGITIVTAAQDEAGGPSGTKTCVVVDCDEFQDAETVAIAGCVEHGNFGARSWPERVDNLADLLRVAHAQALETYLLTQIKAGSTKLNDEAKYGAVSTLLQGIVKAAAFMRNRNRMSRDATLTSLIPAWTIDLMVADVNHVAFNRFVAQAQMEAQLRAFNVNPAFYVDSAADGNMIYGAEAGANLQEFKTTVEWGLYPPGTWLGLDGGRLDLGLVRDSVLNATNDFQLFFETWNGIGKIGIESLWMTSTVCPSGATAPAGTLITCP